MRHMNMELIYEYGSRAGFWRLYRMFTERDLPVTVYAVATAMARNPEAVAAMNEAGWEIATHGLKWIDYRDTPREVERQHIAEAIRIHTEVAGARPLGFYQGRSSINTIRLGWRRAASSIAPTPMPTTCPIGSRARAGRSFIVPYTLDSNDMRFATPQGFNSGDQFYAYLKDSFDALYAEGDVAPKMLSIGLHCRLVGRPGRAASLARFLDYVLSHDKVWVPTRLDIARHWIRNHAPPGGWKPSQTEPDAVRREVRRRLRALALDRGGGLRRGAQGGGRRRRRAGEGRWRRPRRRARTTETCADRRPSRSRRTPGARGG